MEIEFEQSCSFATKGEGGGCEEACTNNLFGDKSGQGPSTRYPISASSSSHLTIISHFISYKLHTNLPQNPELPTRKDLHAAKGGRPPRSLTICDGFLDGACPPRKLLVALRAAARRQVLRTVVVVSVVGLRCCRCRQHRPTHFFAHLGRRAAPHLAWCGAPRRAKK